MEEASDLSARKLTTRATVRPNLQETAGTTKGSGAKKWRFLATLLLVGVIIRVVLFINIEPLTNGDTPEYDNLAINLLHGRGYTEARSEPFPPTGFRAPGYPAFLCAVYSLFGYSHRAVVAVHQLLGIGIIILGFSLARHFLSLRWSLAVAAILTAHPELLCSELVIGTDTLATFSCTTLAFMLLTKPLRNSRLAYISVLLGVTILVRPNLMMLIPLVGGYILCKERISIPALQKLVILALCVSSVLLPWLVRNKIQFDYFGLSPLAGQNLTLRSRVLLENADSQDALLQEIHAGYEHKRLTTPGEIQRDWMLSVWDAYNLRLDQGQPHPQVDEEFLNMVRRHIMSNPGTYLYESAVQFCGIWGGNSLKWLGGAFEKRGRENLRDGDHSIVVVKVLSLVVFPLILAIGFVTGAVLSLRSGPEKLFMSISCLALIASTSVVCIGIPRYRLPLEPLFIITAVLGFSSIAAIWFGMARKSTKPNP